MTLDSFGTKDQAAIPETIDFVDTQDHVVRRGLRGQAGAAGLYYRVAATIVGTRDGRVLVYRRSSHADVFPSHHDVLIGGAVRAGESYLQAAVRELAEELDIRPSVREVSRVRLESPVGPCHLAVHFALHSGTVRTAPGEVDGYALVRIEEVLTAPPQPFVPAGLAALRQQQFSRRPPLLLPPHHR
jgi:8-oxo-dGTP pyrophosphatase MutT (NUDIX family)